MDFILPLLYGVLLLGIGRASSSENPWKSLHKLMNEDELKQLFSISKLEDDVNGGLATKVPNYDVVFVRMRRSKDPTDLFDIIRPERYLNDNEDFEIAYQMELFGQQVDLKLRKNVHLISPNLRIVKTTENGEEFLSVPAKNCHYQGSSKNKNITAALSHYDETRGLTGLLFLPNHVVRIRPVPLRLRRMLGKRLVPKDESLGPNDEVVAHIVTHEDEAESTLTADEIRLDDELVLPEFENEGYENEVNDVTKRESEDTKIELAVFLDKKAYDIFMPFSKTEEQLRDIILGFVNQMQAIYLHPSLGKAVYIVLVYLEIQSSAPTGLDNLDGDRVDVLRKFCVYQKDKNQINDDNDKHWDIAMFLTGHNLYVKTGDKKSFETMGLAPTGGVCKMSAGCFISEFGVTSELGKPYPSCGFLATYVAAHEMAHNLGMHHDGSDKEITKKCDSNGYIMSPSRGTSKENTWSTCSKEAMNSFVLPCLNEGETKMAKTLDHSKYELAPGQVWDAYEQCKLLLKNNDATLYNTTVLQLVCEKVICKIPTREGYYSSGPALEGTYCGSKNWCVKGNCEPWGSKNLEVVKGGWTEWKLGDCTSGCIKNSKGVITGTRTCTNPRPKNSVTCDGPTYKISLCDDSAICSKREDPIDYAKNMCTKLQKYISDLSGEGVQVKHSASTDACSLFCKLKSTGSWYNPSYELNDVVGADTKFPDGTWCHKENDIDYFCQKGKCLPAEKNTRSLSERQTANNNPKPGNALPNEKEVIEELRKGGNPSILDTDDSDIWKDDNDEVTIPVDDNSV